MIRRQEYIYEPTQNIPTDEPNPVLVIIFVILLFICFFGWIAYSLKDMSDSEKKKNKQPVNKNILFDNDTLNLYSLIIWISSCVIVVITILYYGGYEIFAVSAVS